MSDSLEQEIRALRTHFWSDRDPEGRAFAPLADAYRRKGDLAEAESLLQDGLGRLPDFATGRLVAGMVRRDQGRFQEAMSELDQLLDMDPRNVLGMVERARVAALLGDREAAIQDAGLALELEPGHSGAKAVLDELQESAGGFAAVSEELEPAAGEVAELADEVAEPADGGIEPVDPFEVSTHDLAASPDDLAASPHDLAASPEGLAASPDDLAASPHDLAASTEDLDEPTGELEGMEPAPESAGGSLGAVPTRTLGELYARQGALERAVGVYERLLEGSPGDAELTARLAELREQVAEGDAPDARAPQWTDQDGAVPVEEFDEVSAWGGGDDEDPEPASTGRPIGHYFRDLMAWVPGAVPIETLAPSAPGPVPIESLAPDFPSGE